MSVICQMLLLVEILSCPLLPADAHRQLNEDQARKVLALAGWPEGLQEEALGVMWCESRAVPARVGDGGLALGLFQIHWRYTWQAWAWREHRFRGRWDDPVENARLAWLIYSREGWSPWTCQPGWQEFGR